MPPRKPKKAPPHPAVAPFERVEFETYYQPSGYDLGRHSVLEPSAFNTVRIRRFRVTIERVEESLEVLRDRIVNLWITSEYNGHTRDALIDAYRACGATDEDVRRLQETKMGGER